jgi:hypothetical protein
MAIPPVFLGTFVAKHGENMDELLEARGTRQVVENTVILCSGVPPPMYKLASNAMANAMRTLVDNGNGTCTHSNTLRTVRLFDR